MDWRGMARRSRSAPAWRDRRLALGALAAGVVVAVLLAVLTAGGDEKEPARIAPRPQPATVELTDRFKGARLAHPAPWKVRPGRAVTRLSSPDGAVSILVASPTSRNFTAVVRRDAERALLRAYRPSRLVRRLPGRLGSARVSTTEIAGTDGRRRPIRVLSIVTASRWRTYAFSVFSAVPPPAGRLIEASRVLRSVAFFRPARALRRGP